jgi:isoleucyl-tRNA synthetase
MFTKPNPKQNFYELEKQILHWWKENNILNKSIDQAPEDKTKTFYDGPITANGEPHHGHALTFAMKDIIPRYWTMKGYKVKRSLGWDCHGIPVEYEIEKKLGFKEKKDIEKFGIAEFNKLCKESVEKYRDAIIDLEEMMGRLTNNDEEYATMDTKFIESVWWSLKELHSKGLLYEGFKVVPYSTRAGTTLSNAEVALGGYKAIVDPAITVEFPLKDDPKTMLLAWTTTPWTIPTNLGLAVGKEIKYVKVKGNDPENIYIIAKDLVEAVFKDDPYEIVGEISAEELIGKEYIPPFDFYVGRTNAHKIYEGFHVTTESGTGIVHLAPYGAEDNEIFQAVGIESMDVLDEQGDFTAEIAPYAGKNYRDANPIIVEDLKAKDRLFRYEDYEHDMPMCWRTNTPLIYKPITSWYVAVSKMREELVANNNKINWVPDHFREGRFGNWLAEIKDWSISRKRYWGTPLPIWKSESNKAILIGSFEELEKYSGKKIDDPHRPYIDDIEFDFEGERYKRISDVIDVWYDSGAMPFARLHYPFENKELFEKKFPADYISEAVDQTRGWFYSLHAISTTLFNSEAYKTVVTTGHILGEDGSKLSKSKKNYTPPQELIQEFGADTLRLEFFNSPVSIGESTIVSKKTLKIQTQEGLLPLWNIFSYLVTYANLHNWVPNSELAYNDRKGTGDSHPWDHIPFDDLDNNLDAWVVLKLQTTIKSVTEYLENYQFPKATKEVREYINELSKWYIRSNRQRFADGDQRALEILYYCLVEISKLIAPLAPFVSEYIYRELVVTVNKKAPESVHLNFYPEHDEKFINQYEVLLSEMDVVRKICELGHTLRADKGIKLRQPLATVFIKSLNQTVPELSDWMKALVSSELNVFSIESKINIEKSDTLVSIEDTNYQIEIGLDIMISEELQAHGTRRELVRLIQSSRKNMNLKMGDKVKIEYETSDEKLKNLIEENKTEIMKSVSALEINNTDLNSDSIELAINDSSLKIKIETV